MIPDSTITSKDDCWITRYWAGIQSGKYIVGALIKLQMQKLLELLQDDEVIKDFTDSNKRINFMSFFQAVNVYLSFVINETERNGIGIAIVSHDSQNAVFCSVEDGKNRLRTHLVFTSGHFSEHDASRIRIRSF